MTKPSRPKSGPWEARWNLGSSRAGGFAGPEGWYIYNTATGWWSGRRCQIHESKRGDPGAFYLQKEAEASARLANKKHQSESR